MRALEQNYKYDNRGTLYNGSEPNIAFRIQTFKSMLSGLAMYLDKTNVPEILAKIGKNASRDFADNLHNIYDEDVASRKAKSEWSDLKLADKLDQWADYDSSTGWGIVACDLKKDGSIKVVINHLKGLFEGEDSVYFGYFLAGYSETIISKLVDAHSGGKYDEYTSCELLSTVFSDKYTLELGYRLI